MRESAKMRRGFLGAAAAAILAMLVVQIAVAGTPSASGDPEATTATLKSKLKTKLKLRDLRRRVEALEARQPGQGTQGPQGTQGSQGPAGTAPACEGNDASDVMVSAGAVCIDKYEVSVWSSPTGGTQYGVGLTDDYPCSDTGQNCTNIYARSVPGVRPSANITYFQAQQALANAGKRLPTNAEWQQAVAGSPDPGPDNGTTDCRTTGGSSVNTGSRSACVSRFGAFDMVGNLYEWAGDWVPASTETDCPGWGNVGTFSSDDDMCLSGASTTATGPGALRRGGSFDLGTDAGPFAVSGLIRPSDSFSSLGFRGAR